MNNRKESTDAGRRRRGQRKQVQRTQAVDNEVDKVRRVQKMLAVDNEVDKIKYSGRWMSRQRKVQRMLAVEQAKLREVVCKPPYHIVPYVWTMNEQMVSADYESAE